MTIKIRDELPTDIADITALTVAAFLHAPHTSHTEQFIVTALRDARQLSVSLVADASGVIVGHVAISPVSNLGDSHQWYGLGPISVAPELQRRGIGSQLMQHALAKLRAMGAAGCVVLGDPQFYGRFGFQAEASLVLPKVPPEYFLALGFGGAVPSGIVSYHEAFYAES